MNHVTVVSVVECSHQLEGDLAHNRGRHHVLFEPDAEGPQIFSHKLQHETDVVTVGALELEIFDEVANVFVTHQCTVSGAKVSENLSLEDVIFLPVTFRTQYFKSPKSVLVIRPARYRPVSGSHVAGAAKRWWTHDVERSFTSQTVE